MAGLALFLFASYSSGPSTAGNRTGLVASTTGCGGGACHGAPASSVAITDVWVSDSLKSQTLANAYVPGRTYHVSLRGYDATITRPAFGFQIVCADGSGNGAGTFKLLDPSRKRLTTVSGGAALGAVENRTAIPGANAAGSVYAYRTDFEWTAPASTTGPVRFFAVLNAVDGNGLANSADAWDTLASVPYAPDPTAVTTPTASQQPLILSPNPAGDWLQVQGFDGATAVQVFDLSGRTVLEQPLPAGSTETRIKTDLLPAGSYGLRVRSDAGIQVQLFIKR